MSPHDLYRKICAEMKLKYMYVGLELLIPIILWQEHEVRDEL